MAESQGLNKRNRKKLKNILGDLGLGSAFADLIRDAILFDWGPNQFVTSLVHTDDFRARFPGLMQGGNLASFLTGMENSPLSTTTLGQAIGNYRKFWAAYEQVGGRYGYGKINKNQLATLIRAGVSPDEFGAKLFAINTVSKNQKTFDIYNQQRREMGLKPLGRKELFEAVATKDKKFTDTYEAALVRIQGQGLGFNRQEAAGIARAIPNVDRQGRDVGFGDVGGLITQLRAQLGDIGPELKAAGIGEVQLAKFLADPTSDTQGLQQRLEQLVASKRNRSQYVAGSRVQRGAGGGPTTYNPDEAASYG